MNMAVRPTFLPHFDEIRVGTHSADFSDHVKVHRLHKVAMENGLTPMQFARLCAKYEGILWQSLIAPGRKLSTPRYMIINRVANAYPHLSTPQIGRIFNRHHVTVLFNLGRIEGNTPRYFRHTKGKKK